MQGNHVRSSVLAVGLLLALLAGLSLGPRSAATLAQGTGPQVSGEQQAAAGAVSATPLGTAFTYQGRLEKNGRPIDGACDLAFSLWDAPSDGGQVGSPLIRTGVAVSDGLFTVPDLDFGAQFSGEARWLQVAVKCLGEPFYLVLSPRQALTAAPGALSLALPFRAQGASAGPLLTVNNSGPGSGLQVDGAGGDGVYVDSAGSPSTSAVSSASNGFEVAGAEGYGLYVGRADASGVYVSSAGEAGVHVSEAGEDGVNVFYVGLPSATIPSGYPNGFEVAGAEGSGLYVGRADMAGVYVSSTGSDGLYVDSAGSPSTILPSDDTNNGFEVAGAEGDGLYVGRADGSGVWVYKAGYDGVHVRSAGSPSLFAGSSASDGFEVEAADGHGLYVGHAGVQGVHVYGAGDDGVLVDHAGFPSGIFPSDDINGVEVAGAEGNGLYVGRADLSGVWVYKAGDDGVHVQDAGGDGVYANTSQASGEWGVFTPDKIYAAGALASAGPTLIVAQNGDGGNLEPGDVVAVSGAGTPFAGSESPAPLVRRAGAGGGAVVGVVYGRFVAEEEVEEVERNGQVEQRTNLHSRSTQGPAAPGDYLLLVVLGPAQVKASALAGPIAAGSLLAAGGDGQAALLGAAGYVPGGVVGTAMEGLDAAQGSGLIWVLVQPR